MKPQIISADAGHHNANMDATIRRVKEGSQWKRLDTVMIIPTGLSVPTKCVASWMNMYAPPNNKFYRMWMINQEVGNAYTTAIENILAHPQLSKYKYIVSLEHDQVVQPDALVKLLESMEAYPQFAAISGLYWTRGSLGCAQIWGDPRDTEMNFRPQVPILNSVQECCGLGMGLTAFRLEMFKDERLRRPWFKTQTEGGVSTQDLFFFSDVRQYGYRCAVNTSILVGHYDIDSDITY